MSDFNSKPSVIEKTGPQFAIRMGAHMESYFSSEIYVFLTACHILELL